MADGIIDQLTDWPINEQRLLLNFIIQTNIVKHITPLAMKLLFLRRVCINCSPVCLSTSPSLNNRLVERLTEWPFKCLLTNNWWSDQLCNVPPRLLMRITLFEIQFISILKKSHCKIIIITYNCAFWCILNCKPPRFDC